MKIKPCAMTWARRRSSLNSTKDPTMFALRTQSSSRLMQKDMPLSLYLFLNASQEEAILPVRSCLRWKMAGRIIIVASDSSNAMAGFLLEDPHGHVSCHSYCTITSKAGPNRRRGVYGPIYLALQKCALSRTNLLWGRMQWKFTCGDATGWVPSMRTKAEEFTLLAPD